MQITKSYVRFCDFRKGLDKWYKNGWEIGKIATFEGYLIVAYEKPHEPVENASIPQDPFPLFDSNKPTEPESNPVPVGEGEVTSPFSSDKNPTVTSQAEDGIKNSFLNENNEIESWHEPDKPQVGQLGKFRYNNLKWTAVLKRIEIHDDYTLYLDEGERYGYHFTSSTKVEIDQLKEKAPGENI